MTKQRLSCLMYCVYDSVEKLKVVKKIIQNYYYSLRSGLCFVLVFTKENIGALKINA